MANEGDHQEIQPENIERVVEGGGNQNNAAVEAIRRSLEERIEKKEEQILKMEASVFQLANYYFVFQGVILTAIIKGSSSSLKCKYFWIPFSLSLIGAVLNFGTLLIIADKYKEYLDQLDDRTLILYQQYLSADASRVEHKKHKKKKAFRTGTLVLSMILFLIFALLNLIATWIIPCLT